MLTYKELQLPEELPLWLLDHSEPGAVASATTDFILARYHKRVVATMEFGIPGGLDDGASTQGVRQMAGPCDVVAVAHALGLIGLLCQYRYVSTTSATSGSFLQPYLWVPPSLSHGKWRCLPRHGSYTTAPVPGDEVGNMRGVVSISELAQLGLRHLDDKSRAQPLRKRAIARAEVELPKHSPLAELQHLRVNSVRATESATALDQLSWFLHGTRTRDMTDRYVNVLTVIGMNMLVCSAPHISTFLAEEITRDSLTPGALAVLAEAWRTAVKSAIPQFRVDGTAPAEGLHLQHFFGHGEDNSWKQFHFRVDGQDYVTTAVIRPTLGLFTDLQPRPSGDILEGAGIVCGLKRTWRASKWHVVRWQTASGDIRDGAFPFVWGPPVTAGGPRLWPKKSLASVRGAVVVGHQGLLYLASPSPWTQT